MSSVAFCIEATCGAARAGAIRLSRGVVQTPTFMPVGTQGTVRALSPMDLHAVGAQMILSNTYHLHLRPGEDTVAALGGLHRFMAWDGPILTDSGGFQIFSLRALQRVDDGGVIFVSHVDGSTRRITPEQAVDIQWALGSDIAMALDHVVAGTADQRTTADALARTTNWLARCRNHHAELAEEHGPRQTLWPIVQGGIHHDLRRSAVRQIEELGPWTGIAVGGLAVGETKEEMESVLLDLEAYLPPSIPHYLMGVGFPDDLLRAIALGVDLFDCVAPTRNGRNGSAFTPGGPVNIRNAAHKTDPAPLDETCECETCQHYSRGYLRHLFVSDELLGLRLLSLHNLRFLLQLAEQARQHIMAGSFATWSSDWLARYNQRGIR